MSAFKECKTIGPSKREELISALKGELPAEKVAVLIDFLGNQDDSPIQDVYVDAAQGYVRDGDLEIDDNATISEGTDNGAYVQMWKWISFAELNPDMLAEHDMFYCNDCDQLKPLSQKNKEASDEDESSCFECEPWGQDLEVEEEEEDPDKPEDHI